MKKTDNNSQEEDINQDNVRKLQRTGRAGSSFSLNIPKQMVKALGWRERQKFTITKDGKKLIIEDWKE
jgi:antitoxin component of MazEF toxin-antitoxin module